MKKGQRVRYVNNEGEYTQSGTIVAKVDVGCNCDCDTVCHTSYLVKWDNGTKRIIPFCHLTTRGM